MLKVDALKQMIRMNLLNIAFNNLHMSNILLNSKNHCLTVFLWLERPALEQLIQEIYPSYGCNRLFL